MLTLEQKLKAARLMSQVGDPRPSHFREDDSDVTGPTPGPASAVNSVRSATTLRSGGTNSQDEPDVCVAYERDSQTGEVFVVQRRVQN